MAWIDLENLAREVGEALRDRGLRLTTAESCTGGGVTFALTAIAGSSDWFERGFVTYSNAAKQEQLGVPEATLLRHGAVSEPTARAMAWGALDHSCADIALAVTGIAGPGGGTAEKPVGTVCFGWCRHGSLASSNTLVFDGDRAAVREQSITTALLGVLALLAEEPRADP